MYHLMYKLYHLICIFFFNNKNPELNSTGLFQMQRRVQEPTTEFKGIVYLNSLENLCRAYLHLQLLPLLENLSPFFKNTCLPDPLSLLYLATYVK